MNRRSSLIGHDAAALAVRVVVLACRCPVAVVGDRASPGLPMYAYLGIG